MNRFSFTTYIMDFLLISRLTCGHFWQENPDGFFSAINRFLVME